MKKTNAILFGLVGAALFCMQATATPILLSDTQGSVLNPIAFLRDGDTATVIHDLSADIPGTYQAVSGALSLQFSDGVFFEDLAWEFAKVTGDGLDSGWFNVGGTHFNLDLRIFVLGGASLANLNEDGLFAVTVEASNFSGLVKEDFWWKTSKLAVKARPVPEPGTLAMLGAGLLGLGLARRRLRGTAA